MKRFLMMSSVAVLALACLAQPAVANGAGGVKDAAFYVDGELYRTVGTPTDLSNTGAPPSSFDTLYSLGGFQADVAAAAPGDTDYNGGRWMVHGISYNTDYATTLAAHDLDGDGVLDSDAEILSALADGGPTGATDVGVIQQFECPVIPAN